MSEISMVAMTDALTPNQIVAHNLYRARTLRGWTQEDAAERLEAYLGVRWTKATFSAAERSVAGKTVRQFTADDLVAFSRTFQLPIAWFLMPPGQAHLGRLAYVRVPDPPDGAVLSAAWLLEALFGTEEGRGQLDQRLAEVLPDLPLDWRTDEQQRLVKYTESVLMGFLREQLSDFVPAADMLRKMAARLDDVRQRTVATVSTTPSAPTTATRPRRPRRGK